MARQASSAFADDVKPRVPELWTFGLYTRAMKAKLTLFTLIASAALVAFADQPPDLTGAGPDSFKAHLGKVVTLRGRLEDGKQGPCLFGATPTNVVFYVIPDMPPNGSYTYPTSWERLMHQQVRVTGELRFRSFDRPKKDSPVQIPPDYYYMVLRHTSIERLESK
jgi:hypothetical protein